MCACKHGRRQLTPLEEFSFDSSQEQEDLTRAHDGKPIKLPDSSEDYEKLIRRLFPFRCALMSGAKKTKPRVLYPFTRKMLSWHDNPFAGCYTAIGDIVYDLTRKKSLNFTWALREALTSISLP